MRLAMSLSSSDEWRSDEKAIQMIGLASASTFEITGSSMSSGRRRRWRDTRSRTSAAALSASRSMRKRIVIWLRSWRLIDWITSTPSMPASESSSGFVTCDSTISALAPV